MIRHECILFTFSFQLGEGWTQRKSRRAMGENECKKKKKVTFPRAGRAEVNTFPSPGSLVCGGLPLSKPSTHPASLPVPTRPAHPISPPGRRRVSSSALALQTAQKHLVRVEGTRARQDRMWKEAGASGEMRASASRNTTCTRRRRREEKENSRVSAACPAKGWRASAREDDGTPERT